MKFRRLAASLAISSLAVVGIGSLASAQAPGFAVSDTTVSVGESVSVTLTAACRLPDGEPNYGVVNLDDLNGGTRTIASRKIKGDWFQVGQSNSFRFTTPGIYQIQRYCDESGLTGTVRITVTSAPATTAAPTTVAPTTVAPTTAAPTSGAPTTAAPTTTLPGGSTSAPSTTVVPLVEGRTQTRTTGTGATSTTAGSTAAAAATPVSAGSVQYTG